MSEQPIGTYEEMVACGRLVATEKSTGNRHRTYEVRLVLDGEEIRHYETSWDDDWTPVEPPQWSAKELFDTWIRDRKLREFEEKRRDNSSPG
jgi:hypothetical protein